MKWMSCVLVLLVAGCAVWTPPERADIRVVEVNGEAELIAGSKERPARAGDKIMPGHRLVTGGSGDTIALSALGNEIGLSGDLSVTASGPGIECERRYTLELSGGHATFVSEGRSSECLQLRMADLTLMPHPMAHVEYRAVDGYNVGVVSRGAARLIGGKTDAVLSKRYFVVGPEGSWAMDRNPKALAGRIGEQHRFGDNDTASKLQRFLEGRTTY